MRSSPASRSELHTQLLEALDHLPEALDAKDREETWDKVKAISMEIDTEVVALIAVSKPRDAKDLLESVIYALAPGQLNSVERYAIESNATQCAALIKAYRARMAAQKALKAAGM